MILPVYLYNHPVLREKATPVESMSDDIRTFIENMFETMRNADGIGLAANQVGSQLSLTVIDISDLEEGAGTKPMVVINPVITAYSDEQSELEEGCLSLPSIKDNVVRPEGINLRYYDELLREHTIEANGLLSRVLQHEIDHLNGIYFTDKLSSIRRTLVKSKLRRIEKGDIIPDYNYFQN